MKIFLMLPPWMDNTYEEKVVEDRLECLFNAHVESMHFHRKSTNQELFDALCECDYLVLPSDPKHWGEKTIWAIQVIHQLKKSLYILRYNGAIVKYESSELLRKELTHGAHVSQP